MKDSEFEIRIVNDAIVISPSGYINEEVCLCLRKLVESKLAEGLKKVIINLGAVTVINSPGITQFLELAEVIIYDHKGKICFVSVSELYHEVFQVIGLTRFASIFSSEAEAVQNL